MEIFIVNEFLKTGNVDSLQIEMTIGQFRKLENGRGDYKEPFSDDGISSFYDYGEFELCFYNGLLVSIKLKLNRSQKIKIRLVDKLGKAHVVNQKTKLSKLVELLNISGIGWKFVKVQNDTDIYLLTEGGVVVVYSYEGLTEELVHVDKVLQF